MCSILWPPPHADRSAHALAPVKPGLALHTAGVRVTRGGKEKEEQRGKEGS